MLVVLVVERKEEENRVAVGVVKQTEGVQREQRVVKAIVKPMTFMRTIKQLQDPSWLGEQGDMDPFRGLFLGLDAILVVDMGFDLTFVLGAFCSKRARHTFVSSE